jgi:hypothetical protein
MAAANALVYPSNALLLVGDADGMPPASIGSRLIAATGSCVAIGTQPAVDGPTTVLLTDEQATDTPPPGRTLAFDGLIDIPGGRVTIADVTNEIYTELRVDASRVRLQIWVNHQIEPDEISVIVGRASTAAAPER